MEKNEKTAKDKLCELLRGSEDEIQNCLDYCEFSDEQKAKIKELKKDGTTDKEVKEVSKETEKVEDACPHCEQKVAKDSKPPTPPPEKEGVKPVEKVDPKKAKEEPEAPAPAEGAAPAPAEGAAPAPAPAEGAPAEGAAPAPAEGEAKPEEPAKPEDAKTAEPVAEVKETVKEKVYTQDELDEACKKAEAKGRKDGIRAKLLADAVGEDADGKTEADVARAACKKIKGLEFAADASDEVALAAIKGHLTSLKEKKPEGEEEEKKETVKKTVKKTLLSVPTQDEAVAKTPGSFNAGQFKEFLATN